MKNMNAVKWLVVMDTRQVDFYVYSGLKLKEAFHSLHAATGFTDVEPRRTMGRTYSSIGSARHIIEPHTSEQTIEAEYFAHDIAAYLKDSLQKNLYQELVLAAPPKMMGFVRKALNPTVKNAVTLELDKDFMHLTPKQIEAHLAAI